MSKSVSRIALAFTLILAALWWVAGPIHTVRAAADTVGTCDEATLRSVIGGAAPGDTVSFGCSGTITLSSAGGGAITLDKNLTIDGTGQAVTISGNNSVQVLIVTGGVSVTLNHLTIASGTAFGLSYSSAYGGGIVNSGTLSVINSTLANNSVGGSNAAGGGIFNAFSGTLSVTNSTFSLNQAGSGAGIYNDFAGKATLANTILAKSLGPDCQGSITDNGGNFADDSTCGTATQVSTAALNLVRLPDDTYALGAGSVAIDSTNCLQPTDQHGSPRPDPGDVGVPTKCDSGAHEFQDAVTITYVWSGFSQPINDPSAGATAMSVFTSGSTIPVKFQLKNASGALAQATTLPIFSVSPLQKCAAGSVDETVSTATADAGTTYRWDSTAQQYIYNYKTDKSASGMCQFIQATLDDGTTHSVYVGYK